MNQRLELEKPVYTLDVAADMVGSHPRTLMMYEQLGVATRAGGAVDKLRYTLRDILSLRAISRLRSRYDMTLSDARQMIRCLQLLDAHRIPRPSELRGFNIEHVRV
jgi:DNA-binding transcriptional MerR regulator